MKMNIVAIMIGGFCGSILRYTVGLLIPTGSIPYETLVVNILGCFLIGWLMSSNWMTKKASSSYRLGIGTGLIGSFTTFSTFSLEVLMVLQNSLIFTLLYVFLSISFGLSFALLGIMLARKFAAKGRRV
jgi:CrcB protein